MKEEKSMTATKDLSCKIADYYKRHKNTILSGMYILQQDIAKDIPQLLAIASHHEAYRHKVETEEALDYAFK